MRRQLVVNVLSLLFCGVISVCLVYFPSEKSFCCHGTEWKLAFLWSEVFFMLICLIYLCVCLISLVKNERSQRLKVLLNSKMLFEFGILSLFFLCTVSNTSAIGGITINDENESPSSLIPNILIGILRIIVGGLLTLWIFVYDLNYLPIEGRNRRCYLWIRRCLHGFVLSICLYQAIRFGIMSFFWPHVMENLLVKSDHDELYISITLPVSNMFWLRCFFKVWQSEPSGSSDHGTSDASISGNIEVS